MTSKPKADAPKPSDTEGVSLFTIAMRVAVTGQLVAFLLLFLAVVATPVSARLIGGLCGADAVWRLSLMAGLLSLVRCWIAEIIERFDQDETKTPDTAGAAEWAVRWYRFGLVCFFLISLNAFTWGLQRPDYWGLVSGHDQPEYFAYLHSWVFDHDLNFQNEYDRIAQNPEDLMDRSESPPKAVNVAPIGAPVLWLPFYLATHAAVHVLRWFGLESPADGLSSPYATGVAFGNLALVWFGMFLVWESARKFSSARSAFFTIALLWLATPLSWYIVDEAWMSHGCAFFTGALVLYLWSKGPENRSAAGWAALGGAVGLAALVRPSEAALVIVLAADAAVLARTRPYVSLRYLGLGEACMAGVFSLQLMTWYCMSGLSQPPGSPMMWAHPAILLTLFSARHGLFSWHPAAWLGILGVPLLWRRSPRVAVTTGFVLALSLYINASIADWSAGVSFGARRLIATLPFMAPGIAAAGSWGVATVRKRPWTLATAGVVALAMYNQMLLTQFREHWFNPGDAISFRNVWATGGMLFQARFGHPFSYPANLLFAARNGTGPAQYDILASARPSELTINAAGPDLQNFLGKGWEAPHRNWYAPNAYVVAEQSECALLLPLERGRKYSVIVQLTPPPNRGRPQTVSITLNGAEYGRVTLEQAAGKNVEVVVSGDRAIEGLNVLGMSFSSVTTVPLGPPGGAVERGLTVKTRHDQPCAAFLTRLTVRRLE
ncbi:MAG: hypothetical protein HZB26_04100 [Candidatus Hydrogenedentes bacterium]|nr:hypothetical protein [Candidatus Hydrogenedentota bacterium]